MERMAKLAEPIRTLVSPEGRVFNSIEEFNQDKSQKRELFANQMFPRGRQYNGTPDAVGHGLMREQPNAATLGMAFFNYDKDVVAKSRVPNGCPDYSRRPVWKECIMSLRSGLTMYGY